MKNFILFLFLFFLTNSCFPAIEKPDDYFYAINKKVSAVVDEPEEVKKIYTRELQKYKKYRTKKYLISSKYVELSLRKKDKHILVYELLKLNDDKYDYVSIACNYNLALQFEFSSPELALQFLNKAIQLDERSGEKYFLPHLYHQKGRWYYNKKNYKKALFYFNECLKNLNRKETLYVASMHNNFGLCFDKMNNTKLAIEKTRKAINILENKPSKTKEERLFLYFIKGNLGGYFFKLKDYSSAEKLLSQELNFYITENYSSEMINPSKQLFELYTITNDKEHLKKLIDFLKEGESRLKTTDRIEINKIFQKYYAGINNLENLKIYSARLSQLNDENTSKTTQELSETSDRLNNFIIKNINQQYAYQKRKNILLTSVIFLAIITFAFFILNIKTRNKRKHDSLERQKMILENNKKMLEKDIKLQNEKIKSLYHSLNLKIETEKAFLNSLKNIKKQNNFQTEEVLKDLLLKVNNLIQVDKRNYDLISECTLQNEYFVNRLSEKVPNLTNLELKLCMYFRLNLSSKKISSFENTTPNTIRVYKTKIKTKIGLDRETSLDTYLKTI
ncbi:MULTISPECIES: tetratricopeptide repeat protein [Chryseobacterium]|uniref:DNA-binding CsgD family transcriptional regulator/Tfp pilus assembly protein PilF n=1 Tax=Chryseobacterium geocarposphaerae TaxID=1416776 RepID=A0ABU1LDG1_9FLAO|nr:MULTISPECIES: tetratricopeptide repeat protein [Chryseobacterium]MDR6404645.1 DNA-binding CsgD family transcriptional regulator/Tfp pilus assembly protein PilF [Chryseobacterium geocarposphaerae]MDR6698122.1 DNA-binding CsgD family transcriptional regulator/Tfp pilus assembly protein PilF [Chryseobacterium ginsenosidimutans]